MYRYGKIPNLAQQKFGRLLVIGLVKKKLWKGTNSNWLCLCDCGNTTIVRSNYLKMGHTRSCGCLQKETKSNLKHGECTTILYKKWEGILRRVRDKKNKNYGGRGISICKEWEDFEVFRDWALNNGYKDGLTIERIDVNGNYEPSNCTWVPLSEQSKNRRMVRKVLYNGEYKTFVEIGNETGIDPNLLYRRVCCHGYSLEKAITKPIIKNKVSGIGWDRSRNKWRACYYANAKIYCIGRFNTEEDAIEAQKVFINNLNAELKESA